MANAFLALVVPAGDGVGAWVDVSSMSPERTISVDGGAFGGSIYIEGSNDAQASAAPAAVGPFVGPTFAPQLFLQAWNFLRVRRVASGGVGTPTVTLAGPAAIANVFAAMNVPTADGVGTNTDISGGGDVNTFNVVGPFTGQLLIRTSTDGVNFSPTLIFDSGSAVGQTVVGVLSSCHIRRRGVTGGPAPLVSVGSQATSGAAGGGFPGYGAAPPAIAAASAAGASALVSRGDHTHQGALESGAYTAPAALQSSGLLSQTFALGVATLAITAIPTAFPGFGGAPPAITSTSSAGAAGTASRSDHTHALDLVAYNPSLAGMQASGVVQQTYAAPTATPAVLTMVAGQVPYGAANGTLTQNSQFFYTAATSRLNVLNAGTTVPTTSGLFWGASDTTIAGGAIHVGVQQAGALALVQARQTFVRSRGTVAVPTSVNNNDGISQITVQAHDGNGFRIPARYNTFVDTSYGAIVASTFMPLNMEFQVNPNTAGTGLGATMVTAGADFVSVSVAVATNSTIGFTWTSTTAGIPTGVPIVPNWHGTGGAATAVNTTPTIMDSADRRSYGYLAGAWHFATLDDYDPTATRVPFGGASAHTLADSANFTYNSGTQVLTVLNVRGVGSLSLQSQASITTIVLNDGPALAQIQGSWGPSVNATYALGTTTEAWTNVYTPLITGTNTTISLNGAGGSIWNNTAGGIAILAAAGGGIGIGNVAGIGNTNLSPTAAAGKVTISGTVAQALSIAIPVQVSSGNVVAAGIAAVALGLFGPGAVTSANPTEWLLLASPGGNRAIPMWPMP